MRFDRIRLEQFKCYEEADLQLDAGVTVIHGPNGSGKSSLLEACFFALYGAKALDSTLDEVVTIGAEETVVELWFTHAGGSYHVRRRVRVRDDRASTVECVLDGPEITVEGARDVRSRVSELLRMDQAAFVNCAYVRQGEINKLIDASPGDRQDMLDALLQLGTLEEYRERASDARVGVGRVRDDKQGALSQVEDQIAEKEAADLHEQLNGLQSQLGEVETDIENYDQQRETAVESRDDAQAILDEYEEKRERLAELTAEIDELTAEIRETEREREELSERLQELEAEADEQRERLAGLLAESELDEADREAAGDRIQELEAEDERLRDEIEDYRLDASEQETQAETLREQAENCDDRAAEKRERAADLEADLEATRETIAERRDRIAEIEARIEDRREAFADAPVEPDGADDHRETIAEELNDCREREAQLEATLANARDAVEEAEALLSTGKCPECGQPVDGSPHVESLDEDRERVAQLEADLDSLRDEREALAARLERAEELAAAAEEIRELRTNRENVEQLIAEREAGLDDTEAQIAELRAKADELEAEATASREKAAEAAASATEHREAIGECNQQRAEIQAALDRIEAVVAALDRIEEIEAERDRLREQRANRADLNDERRERLAEKRDAKAEIEDAVDESAVESAREEKQRAVTYIEKVEGKLAELRDRRDELLDGVGRVKRELDELAELRDRREDLAATVEKLDSLYEEVEQLEETYGRLRSQLRQRNVESLERMLNETFELVYGNDSYSRIELDGEYRLTVYQKDGEALDPDQLSGGERALFNLSLRCAIYRLLAEGIEGAAPMPPLILDEPTVFLDAGHVSRLVELIEAMRDLGVEQILVVSHDEELVAAADDLVTVRKDARTNRSAVARRDSVDAALLVEAGD